jgi:mevalonate kinase
MGVVSPYATQFCHAVWRAGGAAKITGAGGTTNEGSGSILCFGLNTELVKDIADRWEFSTHEVFEIDAPGFKVEERKEL